MIDALTTDLVELISGNFSAKLREDAAIEALRRVAKTKRQGNKARLTAALEAAGYEVPGSGTSANNGGSIKAPAKAKKSSKAKKAPAKKASKAKSTKATTAPTAKQLAKAEWDAKIKSGEESYGTAGKFATAQHRTAYHHAVLNGASTATAWAEFGPAK